MRLKLMFLILSSLTFSLFFSTDCVFSAAEEFRMSDISSISAVSEKKFIENVDGDYSYDGSNWYFHYDYDNYIEYTVTYSNGETFKGDKWDLINEFGNIDFFYTNMQSYDNQWQVGKHTVSILFMGFGCNVEIEIIKNPAAEHTHSHKCREILLNASCTEKGLYTAVCEICGEIILVETPAVGHKLSFVKYLHVTLYNREEYIYKCDVCDIFNTDYGEYAKLDINRDGIVNDGDIDAFYDFLTTPDSPYTAACDFDGDGVTDEFDKKIIKMLIIDKIPYASLVDKNRDGITDILDLIVLKKLSAFSSNGIYAEEIVFIKKYLITFNSYYTA